MLQICVFLTFQIQVVLGGGAAVLKMCHLYVLPTDNGVATFGRIAYSSCR